MNELILLWIGCGIITIALAFAFSSRYYQHPCPHHKRELVGPCAMMMITGPFGLVYVIFRLYKGLP